MGIITFESKKSQIWERKKENVIMKELPSSRSLFRLLSEKRRVVLTSAGILLAAVSIAIGTTTIVPSDFEVPVLLENGEVIKPPWYVTVEGHNVALVDSEEDAREVVKEVANNYKNEETVDIEIEEKTEPKAMSIQHGDPKPDTMTVPEAVDEITAKENVTVVTTEIEETKEPVKFEEDVRKTDNLFVGQSKVKRKGKKGLKKVTKEVTKENGEVVKTKVKEQVLLKKPKQQVKLVGTKANPQEGVIASEESIEGTGRLARPVSAINITSQFGPRWGRTHRGVDLAMPSGSSISAADKGTVVFAGYSGSYGNLVKIDHGNGMMTYYAHCSAIIAGNGQVVKKGQTIAKVGSTGRSTGPHLHFEVLINQSNVNPMNYL